jgi:hypothetical protein
VVAIGEGDEALAPGFAGLHAVLHGHFERAFDGGGAVVGEEHALQGVRREKRAEFFRQFGGGRVGEAEKRNMRGFFKLIADGGGMAGWAWPWMLVQIDELPSR